MKIIKLGTAYLNMDLVTDVWVGKGSVTVFFSAPTMYSSTPFRDVTSAVTTREVSFRRAQAAALIQWLEKRAKDITPDGGEAESTDVRWEAGSIALMDNATIDDGPSS